MFDAIRKLSAQPRFPARVLQVDAVASGATALLLTAGAEWLQPWLQLPVPLLRGAGLALIAHSNSEMSLSEAV